MLRAKSGAPIRGSGKLLGRKWELGLVESELARLRGKASYFKICNVEGGAGVGKSRLIDELRANASRPRSKFNHVAFVSLESESSLTEVGTLFSLRQELKIECFLFDAALLRYWKAVGQPVLVDPSSRLSKSLAATTIELGGALASVTLPVSFAADVWKRMEKWGKRRQRYKKSEFEQIDRARAEPASLREFLPGCLARDLERALSHEAHSLVVFYDSYEKQEEETVQAGAPWLQAFLSELGRGVHVICSRDPLGWTDPKLRKDLVPVPVRELPEAESRTMIRARLKGVSTEVEDRILAVSGRTPFFIESLVDFCVDRHEEKGAIGVRDVPSSPEEAAVKMLDHRRRPQRALAAALATVQVFDRKLYERLSQLLSVELGILGYPGFVDSFVVSPVSADLSKTHDLLTAAVRDSKEEAQLRQVALEDATEHLLARSRKDGRRESQAVLSILRGVIAGWDSERKMPTHSVETLIDVAYVFHDAGFWSELASIVSDSKPASRPEVRSAVAFIEALTTRRLSNVKSGIERFERMTPSSRDRLGRHGGSAKLELAYLRELAGEYPRARREFRRLAKEAEPFDPNDRIQVRSRLYHADMLTMDGELIQGSDLLHKTYEAIGYRDIVNWGELVRHQGHCYRFSFMLEEAAELYTRALEKTREAPGMTAKLHTNLAEAYCWFKPERALESGELSAEAHRVAGNEIELCKCHAARGIAFARLGEFKSAEVATEEARQLGESADYPAGVVFGIQAEAVIGHLERNPAKLGDSIKLLTAATDKLGTYGHLTVAPLLLRDQTEFAKASAKYEWIEPAGLAERLRCYLDI